MKPKLKLLVKQQRLKLLVKLKLPDYSLTLKPELKLKLQPKQPLTLPLLPRHKGFSFSSLAWMLYLPGLKPLLKPM